MAAIWASLGERPPSGVMTRAAHRGDAARGYVACATPAGALHLMHAADGRDGAGPCMLDSGHCWILFDGVLYNGPELDRQIADVRVRDDARRVLALFEREGLAMLDRLVGMFAFVIWDARHARLYAVRDRFGQKPLYLCQQGSQFALASEIKQLLALPGSRAILDLEAGFDFLLAGLTDQGERTMFAGVRRIPAGAFLELTLDRQDWTPAAPARPWYRLPAQGTLALTADEAIRRFRTLFMQALDSQWRRSGGGALCLSGGIDSSAIAMALAYLHPGTPLLAFKANFGLVEHDQPAALQAVLTRSGASCRAIRPGHSDPFRVMDQLVWHMDEPFGRASLAAQWMLFEFAGEQGVHQMYDGQGADEQLGGYQSMVLEHQAWLTGQLTASTGGSSRAGNGITRSYGCIATQWQDLLAQRTAAPACIATPLGQLCHVRMQHGDLPMMMRHNDRIGAAHRIEAHVPFMDHRLVEYSIALGSAHKLEGEETKIVLRRALADLLPQQLLVQRGKSSYSALEADWLRREHGAPLRKAVQATMREWPRLFHAAALEPAFADAMAGDKEGLLLLWRIACFGSWARQFNVES